ncbi:MAG: cytochrome c3 family protein [Caldilineaceae bacterium]
MLLRLRQLHIAWSLGLGMVALVGASFLFFRPVQASAPPPDLPCRTCHGDTESVLTFPSGETLTLQIDLEQFDHSAHNYQAATPISCHNCHSDTARYRYPHATPSAQNLAEYRAAATQRCEGCHYPHNPFHEDAANTGGQGPAAPVSTSASTVLTASLPTCIDCHGSHAVAPFAQIAEQMPARCVACHTEQAESWAAAYLQPRQGLGQGAVGYAGSDRCRGCHTEIYQQWQTTPHARMIQDAGADPAAILGDFSQADANLPFDQTAVRYTIGSLWQQQYLTRTAEGGFYVLPAQWNVATQSWESYHPDTWRQEDWRQQCSGCHVTGLDATTWEFTEFGVGCESCHGPGAAHVANPKAVKPFAAVDDQVCGACHSRGVSPEGHPFPTTYQPGATLADHFTFTTDEAYVWPDGSAKAHYQQYMDWQLGSKMAQDPSTNCVSCHTVHQSGVGPAQLKAPVNELCVECHSDKRALLQHIPYHEQASTKHDFLCTDCHMPSFTAASADYPTHNHSFLQPNPQATVAQGGVAVMPNACNNCHKDQAEGPEWAAQTIAFIENQGVVGRPRFFEPGPTPTSPPPPTAIPSVGDPPINVSLETGRWLRNIIFTTLGIIAVVIALFVARSLSVRRVSNA